ncbi:hypothetical protein [Pandoraea fibrosis]|uniref:Uncharacterized protein n=1 Tax=Pandoraea fibrosis TaxID=1891094 RepID=A0A5E4WEQ2_9BURK|nr:hypothetical protein [Pandoraea fibrosis]QHE94520.1 hypothetical protein PJ20_023955 [Pandoraea fibrosis]QHF15358.1 hypothetical protein PI93_023960 [Pandoraea fibrosis]VVE23312.1 hypothetical protein PFI31113_03227 [Pandoraea fibrosis]
MPRRSATPSPMSASFAPFTATSGIPSSVLRTAELANPRGPIQRLVQAAIAATLFGISGFAFAQTPVCFDNVGRALPPEQCSKAARDQAAEQAVASGAGSASLRDECRALADKIANTPDKPVYTRDKRVDSPAGDRVDIPTRTNPRKALKEEYVRKCT